MIPLIPSAACADLYCTMRSKKNIFVIIGSASEHSANEKLVHYLAQLMQDDAEFIIFPSLKTLPHFDPELSISDPPTPVVEFRGAVERADGVLICTPEYVFSIPSALKNAVEWCVATTVFSDKRVGLVTASAHGQKGHEELQLLMKTLTAQFTEQTTLLIQGVRGKISETGEVKDEKTAGDLAAFARAFIGSLEATQQGTAGEQAQNP